MHYDSDVWLFFDPRIDNLMIQFCPHCGHRLRNVVDCGISSCQNCNRVFDSSPFNRLLSAAWLVRHWHLCTEECVIQQGFTEEEAQIVIEYIYDKCYSPEEFYKHLIDTEVSRVFAIDTEI